MLLRQSIAYIFHEWEESFSQIFKVGFYYVRIVCQNSMSE